MQRRSREKSATGIYHIMYRGANSQEIFRDEWNWSSCASYYGKSKSQDELLDKNFVLSIFHEDIKKAKIVLAFFTLF